MQRYIEDGKARLTISWENRCARQKASAASFLAIWANDRVPLRWQRMTLRKATDRQLHPTQRGP